MISKHIEDKNRIHQHTLNKFPHDHLYLSLSLIPRKPQICFLLLKISLHFMKFYKLESQSMHSFLNLNFSAQHTYFEIFIDMCINCFFFFIPRKYSLHKYITISESIQLLIMIMADFRFIYCKKRSYEYVCTGLYGHMTLFLLDKSWSIIAGSSSRYLVNFLRSSTFCKLIVPLNILTSGA